MYDLRFKTPFNAIVAGSSGSGKTILIYGLLRYRHEIFTSPPAKVFFFYSEMQDIYKNMIEEKIVDELIEGLPSVEELKELVAPYKNAGGCVCVFDDSLDNISDQISKMFTVISHHMNVSIILVSQNVFYQNSIQQLWLIQWLGHSWWVDPVVAIVNIEFVRKRCMLK